MKIAIIGGGLTGLTAAHKLNEKGYEITIYEKNNHLGGLLGSFKIENQPLEMAYHHIFKNDHDFISFCKKLNIDEKINWYDSSMSIYFGNEFHPFTTPFDLIKFKPISFINRIKTGLTILKLQKTKDWKKLEDKTAKRWMEQASGKQAFEIIWEPLLIGKFHDYYDSISMSWLWSRLYKRGNSKSSILSNEKLGYMDGGFETLVKTITNSFSENVKVELNNEIEELYGEKESAFLKVNGNKYEFDKILVTLPTTTFSNLIPNSPVFADYLIQLNKINYIGAINLVFSTDQDLTENYWNNINSHDISFLVLVNHTKLVGKENYNGKSVYYLGGYYPHDHKFFRMSKEELKKYWFKELKKIIPEFDDKKINEYNIFQMKNAQHIVDTDYRKKIPSYKTPMDNVYLANFSQIYPEDRGMNYAIREGLNIARMIIKDNDYR